MDDLNFAVQLPADFPLDGLIEISNRLNESEICVAGYIPPKIGLYHPHGYIYEHYIDDIKHILLPDRNVASRFAQLAQGKRVGNDKQLRVAAQLLAFAQYLDIEIEPSISFHELAHKAGNDLAFSELAWFRSADNANPQDVIAIALGQSDTLTGNHTPNKIPKHDLAKPIKRWNRNYILALKMMELEQIAVRPVDRVLSLFDWMRTGFTFGGPAALLASVYFAPNSPPKRRVFKDKNSTNREAAIAGVRNAAWDLTQLSEFTRRVNQDGKENKTRYLFATFDKHLRLIAKMMIELSTDLSASSPLAAELSQWWSPSDAKQIASAMFSHIERIQSPDWKAKTSPRPDFIGELIREGERRVREAPLNPAR